MAQTRNPGAADGVWIPGSREDRAPRNDGSGLVDLKSFRLQLHAIHASGAGTPEPARSFLLRRYLMNAAQAQQ